MIGNQIVNLFLSLNHHWTVCLFVCQRWCRPGSIDLRQLTVSICPRKTVSQLTTFFLFYNKCKMKYLNTLTVNLKRTQSPPRWPINSSYRFIIREPWVLQPRCSMHLKKDTQGIQYTLISFEIHRWNKDSPDVISFLWISTEGMTQNGNLLIVVVASFRIGHTD